MKRKLYFWSDGSDRIHGGNIYNASTSIEDVKSILFELMRYFEQCGHRVNKTPHKWEWVVSMGDYSRYYWIDEIDFEDPVAYGISPDDLFSVIDTDDIIYSMF